MQATEGVRTVHMHLMPVVHWKYSKAFASMTSGNPTSLHMGRDYHMSHDERSSPHPKEKGKSLRNHGEHRGKKEVMLLQRDDESSKQCVEIGKPMLKVRYTGEEHDSGIWRYPQNPRCTRLDSIVGINHEQRQLEEEMFDFILQITVSPSLT